MTVEPSGFRFLEHTTDAYIEAWGSNLETAFSKAAEALFETMVDTGNIHPVKDDAIEVHGHDELELLYDWLETLLVKLDISGMVYSKFSVDSISHGSHDVVLHAKISGEKYDRGKHGSRTEVKAITYHQMKIEKTPGHVTVQFLLDL